MTLTEARARTRTFAKNAGDPTAYGDNEIDYAIQAAFDHVIAETLVTRTTSTADVSAGDPDVDLSGVSGFRTDLAVSAWVTTAAGKTYELDLVSAAKVRQDLTDDPKVGFPEEIAFASDTAASLYPTPNADYTLSVEWRVPLVAFTPGTASPDAVTLNVPDDYARTVVMYGAPAFLQQNDPAFGYAGASYQKFLQFVASVKGRAGSRGVKSIQRG